MLTLKLFFSLLGSVFGFVSSDVRSKMEILRLFRNNTDTKKSESFVTIKTMITYEKDADLLKDSKYVSGSRTLLRLHRGLEFVYEFLNSITNLCENDKIHGCCKTSYETTLAKYHPWIVRKGALVAMYALPTQGELLKRVCCNVDRITDLLQNTKLVYDRTQTLYTIHDLHNLP